MTEKTSTDDGALYRAYKFRLDPNQAQAIALEQCAGASRHTYNLLTTYNRQIFENEQEYRRTRAAEGADHETINYVRKTRLIRSSIKLAIKLATSMCLVTGSYI